MLIKTLILNCHDCVLHVQRNLINRDRDTVGAAVRVGQLLHLVHVCVINKGRLPRGRNVDLRDIRRIVNDSAKRADAGTDADEADSDQ